MGDDDHGGRAQPALRGVREDDRQRRYGALKSEGDGRLVEGRESRQVFSEKVVTLAAVPGMRARRYLALQKEMVEGHHDLQGTVLAHEHGPVRRPLAAQIQVKFHAGPGRALAGLEKGRAHGGEFAPGHMRQRFALTVFPQVGEERVIGHGSPVIPRALHGVG